MSQQELQIQLAQPVQTVTCSANCCCGKVRGGRSDFLPWLVCSLDMVSLGTLSFHSQDACVSML